MVVALRYKKENTPLHRVPAGIKLTALFVLSLVGLALPPFCAALLFAAALLCAFRCRWTPREVFADLRPALLYAFILYGGGAAAVICAKGFSPRLIKDALIPNADFFLFAGRMALIMQLSALVFRSTTSVEIKDALCSWKGTARLGNALALTLSFIPRIFENWYALERAWKARGGPRGIRKYRLLLFALLSLSFYHAALKARALAARRL